MSQAVDLLAREAEIIRVIKHLSDESDRFVVIGGYAVNALTAHRYSVDCDLVTDSKGLKEIDEILVREGYESQAGVQKHQVYGMKMKKYVKKINGRPVSVEIFPVELTCRQTEGKWSFVLIKANSNISRIVGVTDSSSAPVPSRELLIAMKIHAGRDTDLRDVTMLSERADWLKVAEFASAGSQEKLIQQVNRAIEIIGKKEFTSSLKAEFSLKINVEPMVRRTILGLVQVKDAL